MHRHKVVSRVLSPKFPFEDTVCQCFLNFILCVLECKCVWGTLAWLCPKNLNEGIRYPGISYKQLWAIWCVHWELNPGRLQEQQMNLTIQPSLYLHTVCLIAHVPKSSLRPDCFIALLPGCVPIPVWTKGLLGQASSIPRLKQGRGCQVHYSKRGVCTTQTKLSPGCYSLPRACLPLESIISSSKNYYLSLCLWHLCSYLSLQLSFLWNVSNLLWNCKADSAAFPTPVGAQNCWVN